MAPKVTVLMPVYNGEKYLRQAIESILSQSYSDFEFLIINDGSTDNTVKIINSFKDKRIKMINNNKNIGQAKSQNKGIKMASGEYIIRMDADDISLQDRIKKQVEFMDANPDIGISGTWLKTIGSDNVSIWQTPIDSDMVKCILLFHPTISAAIMRKTDIIKNKLFYRSSWAEDYDFWVRASMVLKISNINEVLYLYRKHQEQKSSKHYLRQTADADNIRMDLLKKLGLYPNCKEFQIHKCLGIYERFNSKEDIEGVEAWLTKLNKANMEKNIFEKTAFSNYLFNRWFKVCYNASSKLGIWTFKKYYSSNLGQVSMFDFRIKAKFLYKCCIKFKFQTELMDTENS